MRGDLCVHQHGEGAEVPKGYPRFGYCGLCSRHTTRSKHRCAPCQKATCLVYGEGCPTKPRGSNQAALLRLEVPFLAFRGPGPIKIGFSMSETRPRKNCHVRWGGHEERFTNKGQSWNFGNVLVSTICENKLTLMRHSHTKRTHV